MEKKKKTKAKEFFEGLGTALGIIWMSPILIYEEIKEHFEKKRKEKDPKPKPFKFVCSECGEIFTSENKEKAVQGSDGFSYYEPIECPKCHGMRTSPEGADISVYEKIWDMDELWSFVRDMSQDWDYRQSTVDLGCIDYRCTECNTVFKARGIGSSSSWYPFPSRCPNCHHNRTLPADEKNHKVYEPLWTMLELADQTKAIRETRKVLKGF